MTAIVVATSASAQSSKASRTQSVAIAMSTPRPTARTHCGTLSTGSASGRGLRSMRPGNGLSNPRAMAIGTCTTKLIQSTASGENGMPSAIEKIAAPRNVAMKPTSAAIWKRMYFDRLS